LTSKIKTTATMGNDVGGQTNKRVVNNIGNISILGIYQ